MTANGRTPTTRKERRSAERAAHRAPIVTASQPAWRSPVALISLGALVVGVAIVAVLILGNSKGTGSPVRTAPAVAALALRDGRSVGAADAPVTIDLYEDPQCPVCGQFTRNLEPLLLARYVKDGTLRLNYHDFVFIGPESLDAAVGMRAAEQLAGRFWDYQATLFENQAGENKGAFSRDRLAQMAGLIGLDGAAFRALLDDPELIAAVKAETAQGQGLGIDSTPTLVIGGTVRPGLPTWEQLSALIELEAAAAATPVPTTPGPTTPSSASSAPVGSVAP